MLFRSVYDTEKDLEDMLMFLPITVRIIGEEYRDKEFTGKAICEERGIKIWYNSRKHRFSSTELRKRVYQGEADKKAKDIVNKAVSIEIGGQS